MSQWTRKIQNDIQNGKKLGWKPLSHQYHHHICLIGGQWYDFPPRGTLHISFHAHWATGSNYFRFLCIAFLCIFVYLCFYGCPVPVDTVHPNWTKSWHLITFPMTNSILFNHDLKNQVHLVKTWLQRLQPKLGLTDWGC